MARKAPPKGQAKRKAAPPKRKAQTRARAAPPKRKSSAAGKSTYAKRLEKYQREHPGWRSDPHWKQKARGHVEREHIGRRANEVRRLEQAAETAAAQWRGADADEILEGLMERYRRDGSIGFLNAIERFRAEQNARYMAQTDRDKKGRRPSLGINIAAMAESAGLPIEIFWYH